MIGDGIKLPILITVVVLVPTAVSYGAGSPAIREPVSRPVRAHLDTVGKWPVPVGTGLDTEPGSAGLPAGSSPTVDGGTRSFEAAE